MVVGYTFYMPKSQARHLKKQVECVICDVMMSNFLSWDFFGDLMKTLNVG